MHDTLRRMHLGISRYGSMGLLYTWSVYQIIGVTPLIADQQEEATAVDKIISDWQRREERTKTIVGTWRRSQILTGSMLESFQGVGDTSEHNTTSQTYPAAEVRLVLSGNKIRLERPVPVLVATQLGRTRSFVGVCDGMERRMLMPASDGGIAQGAVWPDQRGAEYLANMETLGVMLAFRAALPEVTGVLANRCEFEPRSQRVDNCECTGLRIVHDDGALEVVWVDSNRLSVPLRYEWYTDGVRLRQVDVKYRTSEDMGWAPFYWESTAFDPDGSVRDIVRITDVILAFNGPVSDSEFELPFPRGTRVVDWRRGKPYAVVEALGDGSFRPWRGRLQSNPGVWSGWWIINTVVVLGLIAAIAYRRLVSRQSK